MDLPFPDKSFDLIVVNGVLEWVGEWERNGNPRSIQLDFLKRIHRMLKDHGRLVIGVENRFGQGLFRGGKDHSGIAYTSLMPRWMASLYLRYNRQPHHRMKLNAKREYRTYTYSQRGYKKLLAEGGFDAADFYWADPGYNQPYALVPFKGGLVGEHFRRKREGLQYRQRGWRRLAAKAANRAAAFLAPDFVILAQKNKAETVAPDCALGNLEILEECRRAASSCSLYTGPFSHRSVIRVSDPSGTRPLLIVKISDGTPVGAMAIANEFSNLSLVSARLSNHGDASFAVPTPGRRSEVEKWVLASESVADGKALAAIFAGYPHRGLAILERRLSRCVDIATRLAKLMRGESSIQPLNEVDWQIPGGLNDDPALPSFVAAAHRRRRRDPLWVQHGDYTIENIFFDSSSDKFTLVDWEHTVRGVTPLYDVFSLLLSSLFLAARWESTHSKPISLQKCFSESLFGSGPWAEMFRRLLLQASSQLAIPTEEVWTDLLEFLVLRTNLFMRKSSEMEKEHRHFLVTAIRRREEFVLSVAPQTPLIEI